MALILPWISQVLIGLVVLLLGLSYFRKSKYKKVPGPRGLPLIGNVHQIDKRVHLTFTEWAKKYGGIVQFKMGTLTAFVVSDLDLATELFNKQVATGRLSTPVNLEFTKGKYGIVNAEGETWVNIRRSTLRNLRNLGYAKKGLENRVSDEAQAIVDYMGKNPGKAIKVDRFFNQPVNNSLWNIVTGDKRCKWEDGIKSELMKVADEFYRYMAMVTSNALMFLPVLRYIAPGFFGWYGYANGIDDMIKLFQTSIDAHEKTLDTTNPRDFMDMILTDVKECDDPNSVFYKEIGDKNMKATLVELFIGGSETTAHACEWSMLFLCKEPAVQRKVQAEIDAVVGTGNGLPSLSHRPKMPYTEATVMEILRMANVLPFGVPRRIMYDHVFHDYLLPQGSALFLNSYMIHIDEKHWGDPWVFRPERFLSKDHTTIVRNPAFVPFSVGRRECIGAPLAKSTIFLYMTSILQNYDIERDPNNMHLPEYGEALDGLVMGPKPFNVMVKPRNK